MVWSLFSNGKEDLNIDTLYTDLKHKSSYIVDDDGRLVYTPKQPEICSICQDELETRDHNRKLRELHPCGHIFHESCIDLWFNREGGRNKICPDCRGVVKSITDLVVHERRIRNRNNDEESFARRLYNLENDFKVHREQYNRDRKELDTQMRDMKSAMIEENLNHEKISYTDDGTHIILNSEITDDDLSDFVKVLKSKKEVSKLSIKNNTNITDYGLPTFKDIVHLNTLELIGLPNISILGFMVLRHNRILQNLTLSNMAQNGDECIKIIVNKMKLRTLVLKFDEQLSDESALSISKSSTIVVLNLVGILNLTDVGVAYLAENKIILMLTIMSNKKITDVGAIALSKNTTLQTLILTKVDRVTNAGKLALRYRFPEFEGLELD